MNWTYESELEPQFFKQKTTAAARTKCKTRPNNVSSLAYTIGTYKRRDTSIEPMCDTGGEKDM